MYDQAVGEHIKQFIVGHFPLAKTRKLGSSDPLLVGGVLDSLGVLHVVAYLEKEFNISVTDDDLVPDNFETIDRIVSFVQRKSTAS